MLATAALRGIWSWSVGKCGNRKSSYSADSGFHWSCRTLIISPAIPGCLPSHDFANPPCLGTSIVSSLELLSLVLSSSSVSFAVTWRWLGLPTTAGELGMENFRSKPRPPIECGRGPGHLHLAVGALGLWRLRRCLYHKGTSQQSRAWRDLGGVYTSWRWRMSNRR